VAAVALTVMVGTSAWNASAATAVEPARTSLTGAELRAYLAKLGPAYRKPLLVLDSRWDNADTPVAFIKLSRDLYTLSGSGTKEPGCAPISGVARLARLSLT